MVRQVILSISHNQNLCHPLWLSHLCSSNTSSFSPSIYP
jgi:hypothetical protein